MLNFNGNLIDAGDVTTSSTGVLADGTYTWTVASYDDLHNVSAYTDTWSFFIDAVPSDPPTLKSPPNGAVISNTTPTLIWYVVFDATGYWLDFDGTIVDVGNTTAYNTGILADGTYTWTVAAYDAVGHPQLEHPAVRRQLAPQAVLDPIGPPSHGRPDTAALRPCG